MKCIVCEEDAEFMVRGNSFCREHLPEDVRKTMVAYQSKNALNRPMYKEVRKE